MNNKIHGINFNWKYIEGFKDEYVHPDFDDKDFANINIPHTGKEVPFNNFDEKIYQIESCYRKRVFIEKLEDNQQAYINFGGIMAYARVYVNGKFAGDHRGGYTPFRINITDFIIENSENLLAVYADAGEKNNIPPFGFVIDYLAFSGIYREVELEYTSYVSIEDTLIKPANVSRDNAELNIDLYTINSENEAADCLFEFNLIFDGETVWRFTGNKTLPTGNTITSFTEYIKGVHLWDIDNPNLYFLEITVKAKGSVLVRKKYRFGFRNISITEKGLYLNGTKLKLQGLNRHQSFPYVGYAMPKSAQYKDAEILKQELGLNAVRLSHYPQSDHFLDRCDELGLLVFDEIPGWQYIGDEQWRKIAIDNVEEMIKKDCNHPSVFIWGVRINESQDNDEFYERTNRIAHRLDSTRPTGGARCITGSNLLEDVYTYNDFSHTGKNAGLMSKRKVTKSSGPYMITEYNGHMFPTKKYDDEEHRVEHALRHLNVMDAIRGDSHVAAGFGWCMFDYNTHKDFGSGDKICYHGVLDAFRIPKHAANAYASQQDEHPVMHIASTFNIGEYSASLIKDVYVLTNCDYIKLYKNDKFIKTYYPRKDLFPNLKHPPMVVDDYIGDEIEKQEKFNKRDAKTVKRLLTNVSRYGEKMPLKDKLAMLRLFVKYKMNMLDAEDLYTKYFGGWGGEAFNYRFDGYIGDKCILTTVKSQVKNPKLDIKIDSSILTEEETYDTTRVVIKLIDDYGNDIYYANDALALAADGPIEIIGPKVISLVGGSTGFWIKSTGEEGPATLIISSERFGEFTFRIKVNKRTAEYHHSN